MSYHNTNNETGTNLAKSQKVALSQEERIVDTFKRSGRKMTANDIHTMWCAEDQALRRFPPLLTSVRRALSNLTEAGVLVKLPGGMVNGPYGKKVHYYAMAQSADATQLALF
jgi:Fe2+ or Zn2+ uptake regulation protein